MIITCPKCLREYDEIMPSDPTIRMRCKLCNAPFSQDELFNKSQTKQNKQNKQNKQTTQEEWEFVVDDDNEESQNIEKTQSKKEDKEEEKLRSKIEKVFDLPDLPNAPNMIGHMIESMSNTWEQTLDEEIDADEMPELPMLDNLQEASSNDAESYQADLQSSPSIDSLDPLGWKEFHEEPNQNKKEKSLDALLSELEDINAIKITRYLIQRGSKTFGPFDEEEVHELLEKRKLLGNENTSLYGSDEWKPLKEWDDFRAVVQALSKKSYRIGWEAGRKIVPPTTPPKNEDSTPFDNENSEKPKDNENSEKITEPENKKKPPHYWKQPHIIIYVIVILLVNALFLIWLLTPEKKTSQTNITPTNCYPQSHLLNQKLILEDQFNVHKKTIDVLLQQITKNKKTHCWSHIRFAYYFLESYGKDNDLLPKLNHALNLLAKQHKKDDAFQKSQFTQLLIMKNHIALQKAFKKIKATIHTKQNKDLEWRYLIASLYRELQQFKQAQKEYKIIVKKQPRHLRAWLSLYKISKQLQQFNQASLYLKRAFQINPQHLPTLLAIFQETIDQEVPIKHNSSLQKKIRYLIEKKKQTTSYLLSRWYLLQGRKAWYHGHKAQGLMFYDKALTISPNELTFTQERTERYIEGNQLLLALDALKTTQYSQENLYFSLLSWDQEFRVLCKMKKLTEAEKRLQIFSKMKPKFRYHQAYTTLFMGKLLEARKQWKKAREHYQHAIKLFPTTRDMPYYIARTYAAQKNFKKCKKYLQFLLTLKKKLTHNVRQRAQQLMAHCQK